MQTKRRKSPSQIRPESDSIRSRKIGVYNNLEDALLSSDLDKETLIVVSKLLNVRIDPGLPRPEFAISLAKQVVSKHNTILDFILQFFPNVRNPTDVALFLFFCFKSGIFERAKLSIGILICVIICLMLFAPLSFIINMFRSYLSSQQKKEILRLLNDIEKPRNKKELAEFNQCSYMPIYWKIKHCKLGFSPRTWRIGFKKKI
jgi:hypothetical protein